MKKTAAAFLAASLSLVSGFGTAAQARSAARNTAVAAEGETAFSPAYSTDIAAMLSSCVDRLFAGGYEDENGYFSYGFYYGTPDRLNRYDKSKAVNGTNENSDALQGEKTSVKRTVAQAFLGESSILRITAKRDFTLSLTSESDDAHSYICWAPDAWLEYLAEGKASDGKIYRVCLDRRFLSVRAAENTYALDVALKEGDVFLLVLGIDFKMPNAKNASRWIKFSASDSFDPALHPDFDAMPAVIAAREEKIAALTTAVKAVSAANGYSERSIAAAKAVLADAERRFSRADTLNDVARTYDFILTSLDAAKRLTQGRANLNAAIRESAEKLDTLMQSVDTIRCADVTDRIDELYREGMQAILDSDTPERAAYRYADYQNRIRTLIRAAGGNE